MNRFIIKNHPANRILKARSRHDQLPPGAPGFHGLGNPALLEVLVAGGIAFIHGQQTPAAGHEYPCGFLE